MINLIKEAKQFKLLSFYFILVVTSTATRTTSTFNFDNRL